ncbi:MAG: 2-amino-4-hydroxy-6-hydroxymethyldihydropteridine diphosphokinase [Lachnospiraceae bacterium]
MDQIRIQNLEVFGNHGVFPEETKLGQKFLVNAKLFMNTRQAGVEDDLNNSVNYGTICHEITDYFKKHTFHLIEAVAEHLAAHLLTDYPLIREIELEIVKPWAPIGLPLDQVSVCIHRAWHQAYISFGSNMGERASNIRGGIEALSKAGGCHVTKISDLIVTKAYGVTQQDDFLNGCLELETLLDPLELLMVLHEIESAAGRERLLHWGPRTLDLDILFFDKEIIETKDLIIPHVDMQNRLFVLQPLCQIAPNYRHPIQNRTMTELLYELQKRGE